MNAHHWSYVNIASGAVSEAVHRVAPSSKTVVQVAPDADLLVGIKLADSSGVTVLREPKVVPKQGAGGERLCEVEFESKQGVSDVLISFDNSTARWFSADATFRVIYPDFDAEFRSLNDYQRLNQM